MSERRTKDRRKATAEAGFPLIDSEGNVVFQDRRRLPDRRLSGIEVKWVKNRKIRAVFGPRSGPAS